MNLVKQQALICTGFHRSATSATANYLHQAGLSLGEELVPSHISNAQGHFEDWDLVRVHDKQLSLAGTNLQFHDERSLVHDVAPFKKYTENRFKQSEHWGAKDPRACLFLDDWDKALGETGNYLLIVRHWSCCIESLLHRHSRELAHHLSKPSTDNEGLKLWIRPDLAAQMWLAYNKRLLSFAKHNKDKVLLVSQRALFEGAPILSTLNSRFDFNLNDQAKSPFKAELLRDQASLCIRDSLSSSVREQLDTVWRELLTLADFKSENESPKYVERPIVSDTFYSTVLDEIRAIKQVPKANETKVVLKNEGCLNALLLNKDNAQQVIGHLNSKAYLNEQEIRPFLNFFEGEYGLDGNVLLALGKFLVRISRFDLAITYFEKTITLGTYYPYIDMMIGQCYQALLRYHRALYFYNKAIKSNPNNPLFYTNKAICLMCVDKHDEADKAFQTAIEIDKNNVSCILPYCEFLIKAGREEEAKEKLIKLTTKIDSIQAKNLLIQLELKSDYKAGKATYLQDIKSKIESKDRIAWIANTCSFITSSNAEVDFLGRIEQHWLDVFNT